MITTMQHPTAQLRLQGPSGEHDLAGLRRQLAACLGGGATHISVLVADQPDVELSVLQALNGVAEYLHRRGGELTLVGVQPRVAAKIAVHRLTRLGPSVARRQEELA